MNLIVYLIVGAIVGYVASRIMHTNSQQGLLMDIVVGVAGAFLAGFLISPLLGIGTINDAITLPTVLVSLLYGGSPLGVVGAILAVPTAAILQVIATEIVSAESEE